ncbi:tRNA-dependent cyclodipeptide synthase [Streptomyces sp. NPDC059650]|uniref:tRNA-dependent cyclodipeptide synthase n=1 Tax=Streptomyces sp. NPDC059650 TaxID=3346896 RepID=UPI003695EC53
MLIGVSPGHSYLGSERVNSLARWAAPRFAQVDFVYADLHVDRMFAAFGYSREHAEKRAAKEIKAVRRRIVKGVEESGHRYAGVRVRALSEFDSNPVYQLLHRRVRRFLETDDEFRRGREEMALRFVGPKLPEGESITAGQLQVCFDYLAAELPFSVDTPSILDVPSSVAAYHVRMPLTDVLCGRGGYLRATRDQAYAVVRPEAAGFAELREADPDSAHLTDEMFATVAVSLSWPSSRCSSGPSSSTTCAAVRSARGRRSTSCCAGTCPSATAAAHRTGGRAGRRRAGPGGRARPRPAGGGQLRPGGLRARTSWT